MPVFLLALERRQELTEKIIGVSSEFINLKKLNNSLLPAQKTAGRCKKK